MYSMPLFLWPELPQLDPGLFLNAFQSAHRYVSIRMRHRYPSRSRRVPELFVTPDLIHLKPAVAPPPLYDFPAVHFFLERLVICYTRYTHSSTQEYTRMPHATNVVEW